ncbi:unnamed protein product [Orchesella dallaii]|uniref:Zinc finger homeobox protein 4 n=1 Tax=Orchesella dallaii TaxID=48710 RepID=A0ABP1PL22_9HEXA
MEAFVAVAKAQGDESQLSSANSLDSPSSFSTSCRNSSSAGSSARQNFSALLSSVQQHSNSHHVSASAPNSSLSRRDLLDNGHYWKYLVGESSLTNMVPQEPTMATNDGVSKTPSPSSSSSVVAGGGVGVEEQSASTTRTTASPTTTPRPSNPTESTTIATTTTNNSNNIDGGDDDEDDDGMEEDDTCPPSPSPTNVTKNSNSSEQQRQPCASPPPPPPSAEEMTSLRSLVTNNNTSPSNNNSSSSVNNSSGILPNRRNNLSKSNRSTPPGDSGGGSDVERFEGKIVYNPDGSAYIIEDSELSDDETSLDVPEGCIVDGRGANLAQFQSSALPQIANAIYVSRNPALYTALYGQAYSNLLQDKKMVPDIPIIHSYRVFTIRDSKSGDTSAVEDEDQDGDDEEDSQTQTAKSSSSSSKVNKSRTKSGSNNTSASGGGAVKTDKKPPTPFPECASVPIKPILMCFICKLSFGYTKSFVGHAMGDHKLILNDQENDILNQRNISAIIQQVGKNKDALISFLEPLGNRIGTIPMSNSAAASAAATASAPLPLTTSSLPSVPMSRALVHPSSQAESIIASSVNNSILSQHHQALLRLTNANNHNNLGGNHTSTVTSDDNANNLKSSPASSPDNLLSPRAPSSLANDILSHAVNSSALAAKMGLGVDLTRKSPASGRSSASPGASVSPAPGSVTPNPPHNTSPGAPGGIGGPQFNVNTPTAPPNFITGTTIGVCPEHINGRPSGVDCAKCELILNSSRMGGLGSLHTRNSCKTLKCPKCNWHYKYQETLEIHMKEKHPDNETSCIYCIAGQPHPRLARGETYTCGYKPYRCEVCNYSTTTKGNLSIHMQSDKHLNNMQELQNGGISPPESLVQQTTKSVTGLSPAAAAAAAAAQAERAGAPTPGSISGGGGGGGAPPNPKPKPTFRCDVCNYETNVARNLRIHMTSEKHTHNMMVLQQNVKHMQHLSALQQAQNPFDPAALMQFHPGAAALGMASAAGGAGDKPAVHTEAALADMAYSQALLIQMMTGGQMPPHIPPELAPHMDLGLNPDTMEPPPEPPDPNPSHLFQCCVCTSYHTDSLEALSHHLTQDRTKLREQEILVLVAGNYMCKLCSYKTNLKANFQLHCKTDKHLQRLQHVNHVKEGGPRNEWKLKYLSMSNPIQVRCNACDYYTNSAHKLQLHAAHQRHEISVLIFRHIQNQENAISEDARIYACALCGFTSRVKLQLLQHTRSIKHLQLEQLHSLQRRAEGKDGQPDLTQIFRVLEQPETDSPVHNNNSAASAEVSPNFYNDQDSREIKREENSRSSVLKNALEKESSDYTDLTCPYCTFTADSETRLQIHVVSQHSNSEWSGTSTSSGLERERQRDRERSSSVPRRSSSPESNKLEASTSEQMACPLCQETCSDRHKLENHVMQVHSVNAEGLKRLLLLVNQSHWLNTSSGRSSANNSSSSSGGGVGDHHVKSGGEHSHSHSSSSHHHQHHLLGDEDKDKSETDGGGFLEENGDSDEFRCQSCLKSFRNLDDLCTHQNETGHLEIKQTPGGPGYLCWKKGCNQYFPTAPSLQMHFREIHARGGGQSMAVSEKHVYKYRCNQCSLAFKTMEKLQIHSQYHAIRDASKCCLCGRSFRSLLALQKHVETSHTELSEDELNQFKQSIASNPLLLAGLSGQVLDPATTELLKKESARGGDDSDYIMDEEMMMNRDDSITGEKDDGGMNESGGDGDSNDSVVSKDQQLFEDYLNSQAMAEDSYNDPNRKYKCHRCKVAFTRQSYLTSHNKTLLHRKGEKLSYPMEKYLDPNRPYKCEVCKESFTQKNILLVHYNSVSHLHKLKRAMQEQQQFLSQLPTSSLPAALSSSSSGGGGGAPSNLISPVSSSDRGGNKAATNTNNNSSTTPTGTPTPATPNSSTGSTSGGSSAAASALIPSTEEDDKKPYKCNICKVAYTQGSTLDIHMRSVLHQTRASKLHELAMTGQIDLSKPLIEQPEHQKLQEQQKKLMQEMLSPKSGEQQPLSFSTPIRASSPASSGPSSSPQNAVSPAISSSPQTYPCHRCNVVCGSQEQLLQHQHLYCMFQNSLSLFPPLPSPNSSSTPNTSLMGLPESQSTPTKGLQAPMNNNNEPSAPSSPVPMLGGGGVGVDADSVPRFNIPSKKSSHMFKHLLETYGFEVVMQFNEYHQKRLLREVMPVVDDDAASVDEQVLQEFPELAKASCPNCKKSFSSVWILKAHCEEIHKDVVSTEVLETFAEDFRAEYLKKVEVAAAEAASALEKDSEELMIKEGAAASIVVQSNSNPTSNKNQNSGEQPGNPTAPSTPTASTTPASSADSISGGNGDGRGERERERGIVISNNANNNSSSSSSAAAQAQAQAAANASGHQAILAQHMNDVQAALTAMAASQLQHFNPMINPMMMAAQLGMALPLGLNMNALAAMNLQPPLVPMMMPPPYDTMNQLSQNQNNRDAANAAASAALFQQNMEGSSKQQQQMLQQQQAAVANAVSAAAASSGGGSSSAGGQKRARTRITDEQLKILRSHFDINNSPSEEQISQMAQQSGLPPKVIKHWFRNTLFKERQRNKDSPYNFNNPPSTTLNLEEYEKTGEAKVLPLPPEEQKKYIETPLPSNSSTSGERPSTGERITSVKKESSQSSKKSQHQQQQQVVQQLHHHHQLQQHQLQQHQQQLLNAMHQEALDMKYYNHDNQSEASESESRSEDERPTKVSKRDFGGSNSSLTQALQAAQKNQRSSSVSSLTGAEPNNPSSSPSAGLNLSSLMNSQLSHLQQDSNSSSCSQPMLPPPKMGNFATPTQVSNQTSLLSLASPVALSSPGSGRSDTPLTTPPLPSNASQSSSSGKRANRTRFTDYQIKVLQEFFENNAYPKDDDLEYLSKLLSLSPRVIVVWFQNARQKARKVYENQPPLDQQEEGTGRFQRTPGLNYQCKKCLLVFQRYYELIRHQKTHCYKEEDAKRSAQAQAAAAQVAAAMSSEDSNSSTVTDNNSMTSSCGPSPVAPGQSNTSSGLGRPNPSQSPMTLFNAEMKAQMKLESQDETFQCDKCNLVFPRFDLWREHQLVHIMNPNLFPSYSPESPFGILQHHAQQQQQAAQAQAQAAQQHQQERQHSQPPQSPSPIQSQSKETTQQSHSAASSIAGDATGKRKWSADDKSDDDKEETQQQRDKRLRTTILPEQLDYLYQKYQVESNPSRKMLETIAREVGLKKRVVQVWFQNTRARERKGQFRAHAQVINKRCPFCPALFKVKSALETHLAAKHADQYTKGDINIDALPDEELDSASSPLRDNTKVPISFGASTTNSLGAAPSSPSSNLIAPFLHSLSTHAELETSLKKLYEESLKRYAQEVQAANQNGRAETGTPTDLRMMKGGGESGAAEFTTNPGGEIPLDLSKPVDLSRAFGKIEALDTASLMDNDYLSGESDEESVC